jgi:hypothetical protein
VHLAAVPVERHVPDRLLVGPLRRRRRDTTPGIPVGLSSMGLNEPSPGKVCAPRPRPRPRYPSGRSGNVYPPVVTVRWAKGRSPSAP